MSKKLKYQIEVDTRTGEARVVDLGSKMEAAGAKGRKGFENAARGLNSLKKKLNQTLKVAKTLGGKFASLGKKVGGVSAKMAGLGVAGAALTGALTLTAPITQFATFEKELANVSTLVDTSAVNMEAYKKEIMALPSALGSASELTRGLYQTISAGVAPGEAMKFLEKSARAAKAGLTDTFTAVDAGSTVINAFGMKADEAGTIFDLMFTAVKEGKTTFSELAGSVGKISPIAAAAGVSVQEMHAAIATLTKGGFATSEASSRLATALGAVVKPTAEAQEMAASLGLNFNASALAAQGLHGFLQDVKAATGGNVEQMAQLFGGMESLSVMLALTGEQSDEFTRVLGSMENAAGSTDEAFSKQTSTLSSLWETFVNTVGKQAILIGEKLAPSIKSVIERTEAWMEANRDLITEELGDWIESLVDFAGKLKPAFDDIVARVGDWYQANENMLKMEFVEYLENAAIAITGMAENINLALVPVRALGMAFNAVGEAIAWAVMKVIDLVKWMWRIPTKITTLFTGRGSSERMLSEKITEMKGKFGGFSSYVDRLSPKFMIDATPATSALGDVARIQQGLLTGQGSRSVAMGDTGKRPPETLGGGAYSLPASSLAARQPRTTSARSYTVGGGQPVYQFGDININIPESAAPQRPEDWRHTTREYIIPELKAMGAVYV